MSFSRKVRQAVYDKCHGHCAYCGCELAPRDMQVDHVVPVYMNGTDDMDNLLPSCRACNFYKGTWSLEGFRRQILETLPRSLDRLLQVRLAVKYGMVTREKPWDGKFYFEKDIGK